MPKKQRQKRRYLADINGAVLGWNEKELERRRALERQAEGKFHEEFDKDISRLQGYRIIEPKRQRGYDYIKEDELGPLIFGTKPERKYVEVKSGPHAKHTKTQREFKRKHKKNYETHRY
jgi:hypothetical protein